MGAAVTDHAALRAQQMGQARRVTAITRRYLVAERTLKGPSNSRPPPVLIQHPLSELERGVVPNVLPVTAAEFGYPVTHLIAVESDDYSFHKTRVSALSNLGVGRSPCIYIVIR